VPALVKPRLGFAHPPGAGTRRGSEDRVECGDYWSNGLDEEIIATLNTESFLACCLLMERFPPVNPETCARAGHRGQKWMSVRRLDQVGQPLVGCEWRQGVARSS
jgi:hypothetical protein